jgi:hypothetical protein
MSEIQALDTWTSLQVSQNFRPSDKYSYGSYQQLRIIFDKLELSAILKDDFIADIYQVDSDLGSIRLLEI